MEKTKAKPFKGLSALKKRAIDTPTREAKRPKKEGQQEEPEEVQVPQPTAATSSKAEQSELAIIQ